MGELGDQIEARVDPALVGGSRDPVHNGYTEKFAETTGKDDTTLANNLNVTEVAADDGLPTQEELATLRRVPAKIPWRGKCSFDNLDKLCEKYESLRSFRRSSGYSLADHIFLDERPLLISE